MWKLCENNLLVINGMEWKIVGVVGFEITICKEEVKEGMCQVCCIFLWVHLIRVV